MITLTAGTAARLIGRSSKPRLFMVYSDSTTITRLSTDKSLLEETLDIGTGLTAYIPRLIQLSENKELWVISTGTPTLWADELLCYGLPVLRM